MILLIKDINKSDARKLVSWWNANTKYYHFYKKQTGSYKKGNLYNIYRQL